MTEHIFSLLYVSIRYLNGTFGLRKQSGVDRDSRRVRIARIRRFGRIQHQQLDFPFARGGAVILARFDQ
ncbi:hypothetical protein [Qipengyuania sp. 902]|uniref:hypothetical protein n=1 Tax=Qipengyuania sp. 902 TaxID=3417565 RepID=UPI003EBD45A5